jgi:hypothetical protein
MAEESDDSNNNQVPALPDFTALLERAERIINRGPYKKLEPVTPHPDPLPASGARGESPRQRLPEGGGSSAVLAAEGPWTEDQEFARLLRRAQGFGLPADSDDLNDAINEKIGEGYRLPAFVFTYQRALRAAERRRMRRPRHAPKTKRQAAYLMGRILGHIEAAMEDYLTDTYEVTDTSARPALMFSAARMASSAAKMSEMLASLNGDGRRVRVEHPLLASAAPEPAESEAQ